MSVVVQEVLPGDFPDTVKIVVKLDQDTAMSIFDAVSEEAQARLLTSQTIEMNIDAHLSEAAATSALQNKLREFRTRAHMLQRSKVGSSLQALKGKTLKI